MLAVISDIHGNVEALKAVLADIATRKVEQIICLGDVIGYGPQPKEALDLVMQHASVTLMGNHDYAVLYEPNKFNLGAETACYWSRKQLEEEPDAAKRRARWDFLGGLKLKHVVQGSAMQGEMVFVHGSPRRPINEYIFPDDVYSSPGKMDSLFDRFSHLCFVGHTHVPGVYVRTPDFYTPEEIKNAYEIDPKEKALINVGSVGQPRDRDARASYVLIDPDAVNFIRVPYDVDAVVERVTGIAELDNYLGSRLKDGR